MLPQETTEDNRQGKVEAGTRPILSWLKRGSRSIARDTVGILLAAHNDYDRPDLLTTHPMPRSCLTKYGHALQCSRQ